MLSWFLASLASLASLVTLVLGTATPTDPFLNFGTTPALNITALDAKNGESVLECWRLDHFQTSSTPGLQGSLVLNLGDMSNATYSITSARHNAGLHRAPAPQLVLFLSGLIHITLPNSTDEAWITGGKYGFIYAQDTADKSRYGHGTAYVSDADTVALAVPLAPGRTLNHTFLHSGACTWAEMAGL